MTRKKKDGTFKIELKPAVEVQSGEPHVFLRISQPVCFGEATLILSERDISAWEKTLVRARSLLQGWDGPTAEGME